MPLREIVKHPDPILRQRARPVALYDAAAAPYDPDYYLKKLDDWLERYGSFLGIKPHDDGQGELL